MQPLPPIALPDEPLTASEPTALLSPAPTPVIPPAEGFTGNTDSAVLPVLPETGNTPVNPVNNGNLAGLPEMHPEGNTDDIVAKTYKLPAFTVASMQRVILGLNEVIPAGNPPYTMHSYGVETLNNHEIARRAITSYNQLQLQTESLRLELSSTRFELDAERQKVQDLQAQLKQQADYIARQEHHPTPSVTPPPIVASAETESAWHAQYIKSREQVEQMAQKMGYMEKNALIVQASLAQLPTIVAAFCQEAARNTWFTAEYYQWYFNQLVAYYADLQSQRQPVAVTP